MGDGRVAGGDPRQPGLARSVGARVPARQSADRRCCTLGRVLDGGRNARGRPLGRCRRRDVSRPACLPGAVHRLPVRRDPRRPVPHRCVQAGVLWLCAGGPRAADRAGGDRGRPGASFHCRRAGRRADLRPCLRTSSQRRHHPVAHDAPRKRGPHPRAQGADRGSARGARRRRDREPREKSVPCRGEPRLASTAARNGPLRGRACRESTRPRSDPARREHPRVGGSARASLRRASRPVAARRRRAATRTGGHRLATALRAAHSRFRAASAGGGTHARRRADASCGGDRPGAARAGAPQSPRQCRALHAGGWHRPRRATARARRSHRRRRHRHRHRRERRNTPGAAWLGLATSGSSRPSAGTRSSSPRPPAAARASPSPCRAQDHSTTRAVAGARQRRPILRRRSRSPDGGLSLSTTIRRSSPRCRHCSLRGTPLPPAAPTLRRQWPVSPTATPSTSAPWT